MIHREGNQDIKVIGHRGTLTHAHENTMYAFESAYEMGANWVETDVTVTADGAFVLIHDQTIDRTTDGAGTVSESSLSYIAGLDAAPGSIRSTRTHGYPYSSNFWTGQKRIRGCACPRHKNCLWKTPIRFVSSLLTTTFWIRP